jgi:glucan-binding YG repeat protein
LEESPLINSATSIFQKRNLKKRTSSFDKIEIELKIKYDKTRRNSDLKVPKKASDKKIEIITSPGEWYFAASEEATLADAAGTVTDGESKFYSTVEHFP